MIMKGQFIKLHPRVYDKKELSDDVLNFISFINLIDWFKLEIKKIVNGAYGKDVFSVTQYKMMVKHGVLLPYHKINWNSNPTMSYPSCLSRMVLYGLIDIDVDEVLIDE